MSGAIHEDRLKLWEDVERLTRRVAELQQFHDWAEPQIHDHGRDVLTIERLTRERDQLLTAIGEHVTVRSDQYAEIQRLRTVVDGIRRLPATVLDDQWRSMALNLVGEGLSGEPGAKRAYYETHDPPHCPTCGCGSAPETAAEPLPCYWPKCDCKRAIHCQSKPSEKASAECQGCKEGWDRQGPWHWDSIGHMHKCTAQKADADR